MDKVFRFFVGALTIIACAGFAESAQNPKIDCCKASYSSIRPDLKGDKGISFSSDFLYWQTSQTGMWYGQVANFHTTIPNPAGGNDYFFGDYKNPGYKFDPGVRVSLGFKPQDDWQIDFVWTHMNSKAMGFSDLPGAFETSVIIPNPLFFVPQILNNNSVTQTLSGALTTIRSIWISTERFPWVNILDSKATLVLKTYGSMKNIIFLP